MGNLLIERLRFVEHLMHAGDMGAMFYNAHSFVYISDIILCILYVLCVSITPRLAAKSLMERFRIISYVHQIPLTLDTWACPNGESLN